MELTAAALDPGFGPTYRTLGISYELLLELGPGPLDDALAHLDVERNELERLRDRYLGCSREFDDTRADSADLSVLVFLLQVVGAYSGITRSKFEASMTLALNGQAPSYFVPFWIPCVAALGAKALFVPVIAPRRTSVLCAYEGLVRHVRQMPLDDAASELSQTAILWRVAALVDGLEPSERSLYDKMNEVRGRVIRSDFLSEHEKRMWQPLTRKFADRRHALSHIVSRDGETFESASAYAMMSRDDLRDVSSALGFAVLQEIAAELASMPPPSAQWKLIWDNTRWIDEQV